MEIYHNHFYMAIDHSAQNDSHLKYYFKKIMEMSMTSVMKMEMGNTYWNGFVLWQWEKMHYMARTLELGYDVGETLNTLN